MRTLPGALVVAAFGVVLVAGPAVAADTGVDRAVAAWKADGPGVYLDPSAVGEPLTRAQADRLDRFVGDAESRVYVAALGEQTSDEARVDLRELIDRFDRHGTYVVVGVGGFLAASDVPGVEGSTEQFAQEATDAHPEQPAEQLTAFVRLVDAAASSGGDPVQIDGDDSDEGSGAAAFVLVGLLAAAAAVLGFFVVRFWRRSRREQAEEFADVQRAADEDVTVLGEELTALEVPPATDADASADYAAALDAYERAKDHLALARRPDDLRPVTTALEDGRWRLACVRARLAGEPVPERRPPCFFNPRHGPSTQDVGWAPDGGAPRSVPVCAADADRLDRGDEPDSRLVTSRGRQVPYWQGPAGFGPYAGGFFGGWGGGAFLGGLLVGQLLSGPAAYAGDAFAGHDGTDVDDTGDVGDGDFGGDDFAGDFDVGGGGDWGGGFGGGDFGGGDFGGGDGGGW